MSTFVTAHEKAPEQFGSRYRKKFSDGEKSAERTFHDVSSVPSAAGNFATERLLRSSEPPSPFKVNPPDDIHEQEADELAELATQTSQGNWQRKPKNLSQESSPVPSISSFSELTLSSGRPLDAAHREHFEERFGADLSHVRIHTDPEAAATADAIDAEAFTIGSQIVFGTKRYQPNTSAGQRLLGHEVAHVIQQTSRFNQSGSKRVTTQRDARRIQRQPGPDMLTEPVSFIESQLKIQFTDPDDPRLSIRVRRLQEAFGKLTISEARETLERLRDPGSELAKNFQRLATASRNRLRAILLKALPAEIEGKVLGWAGTPWAYLWMVALEAKIEVMPSTEEAGMFPGYADAGEARDAVIRRPTICAVVLDKKLGRYRAFDTGLPPFVGVPDLAVSNESNSDFTVVEWVNLEGKAAARQQTRGARIIKARSLLDEYIKKYGTRFNPPAQLGTVASVDPTQQAALKQVQDAYEDLFAEALPFAQGQLNFEFEFTSAVPSGPSQLTTAKPGSINIEIFDQWAHGRQKMLDPIEDLNYPGTHRRVQFKEAMEEDFALLPEPYVALAVSAVEEEPLETRRVLLHERTHLAHAERAMKLIEDWKGSGSSLPFTDWVSDQLKKRQISSLDAILAIERAEQKPSSLAFNTEVLAEIEGFMGVYHVEPPVKNLALERLPVLVNMWLNANPEVRELSIRKLHHYYWRMLDQTHRNNFDEYVMEKLFNNPSDPRAEFYQRLIEFSGMP